MSSQLEYRKEFETIVLTNDTTEALKSIIPGSLQELFILFNEELKRCAKEKIISEELNKILGVIYSQKSGALYHECNLRKMLIEYDLPSTSQDKKKEIIDALYKQYSNAKLDFLRPDIATKITLGSSDKQKYPTALTEEMINDQLNKLIKANHDPLYEIKTLRFEKKHQPFEELETLSDDYSKLILESVSFPYYLLSPKATTALAMCIKKMNKSITNKFPFDQFTIEQLELMSELNLDSCIDKATLIDSITKKKYQYRLEITQGDYRKQRELLIEIYNYAKKFSNSVDYTSIVLLLILQEGIKVNHYDLDLFNEFLNNPVYGSNIQSLFKNPIKKNYSFIGNKNIDITSINELISRYLRFFFINDKAAIKDFDKYLNIKYLQTEEIKAKILKGEAISRDNTLLSKDEYDALCKEVNITLCEHNKETFGIDEDVIVDLDIKNVPVLFVKIFEINTENYYLINKKPITSLINIEGLITKLEDTYSFNESPQKIVRQTITFDKIPKRRGVYLIELIGNGISSRIIIKKGNLSIISRSISIGKLCYILDENHEICKENTGLWYNGSRYTCDKDKGSIIIPYQLKSGDSTVILFKGEFADIGDIDVPHEEYTLKGEFHLNHESIMTGNTSKIILKPLLLINQRETLLSHMKKPKVTVSITKEENQMSIPIINTIEDIQFDDIDFVKQLDFDIQIPPRMTSLEILFECEVFNHSQRRFNQLSLKKAIPIDTKITSQTDHFFLRQSSEGNYTLALLGKNGEAKEDEMITLELNYKDYLLNTVFTLETNSKGEIDLGSLSSIQSITAKQLTSQLQQLFQIKNSEIFSYPELIDTIKDQKIILPYQGKESDIKLVKVNSFTTPNIISAINLTKSNFTLESLKTPMKNNYQLTISSLEIGKYILYLNYHKIYIEVHDGKYWTEGQNFIITNQKLIENSSYQTPIYIKELTMEENTIKFKLNSLSKNAYGNVFLFQYLPNSIHTFGHNATKMLHSPQMAIEQSYQQWTNIYLSNRTIHEEIQYVIDRKNNEQSMGNSLEMPSLLLKRQFTKESSLDEETINLGNQYEKKDAEKCRKEINKDFASQQNLGDQYQIVQYSDFQNFISQLPYTQVAITPNDDTDEFTINLPSSINHWEQCHIVCYDDKSICSEIFPIEKPMDVTKRNITLDKALNNEKNYTEIRKTEVVRKDEKITISEISNYNIIDSVTNALNYILVKHPEYRKEWTEISFIIENITDEEKLLKKISQYISHEVNIFIYFKYPDVFEKVIKPILKYKFEKTFIDYFLLDDMVSLKKYLTSESLKKLNVFELCLIIMKISKEMPEEAKKVRNVIKKRINSEHIDGLIRKNFDILMNMKLDVSADIEKEQEKVKEKNVQQSNKYSMPIQESCIPQQRMIALPGGGSYRGRGGMGFLESNRLQKDTQCGTKCSKKAVKMCQSDARMMMMAKKRSDVFSETTSIPNGYSQSYINPVQFDKPSCAKEYKERHYLSKNHKTPLTSPLWLDFADHLLSFHSPHKFLSKYILSNQESFTEIIWLLSVLDLPIISQKHIIKRVGQRSLEIQASNNMILFTKEIAETNLDINKHIFISQNVVEYNKSDSIDSMVFKKNTVYTHETIITNISNKQIDFDLFIQIPEGAIPMHTSYYTQTHHINLQGYITLSKTIHFYFPNEGVFVQYHPVATVENNIISLGEGLIYKVQSKKTWQPSSNEDNKLEMIIANGDTKDILDYFQSETGTHENIKLILWLLNDKAFYMALIDILRKKGFYNDKVWNFAYYHYDEVALKEILNTNETIKNFLGNQFDSSLVKINSRNNYNVMNHLEYAPLFNARAHLLGKGTSGIMNSEFKQTYQTFIISLLKVPVLTTKSLLRLSYYLILQDRIEEAMKVFERITIDQTKEGNDYESIMIQYDYINAYLDFSLGYPKFDIARTNCLKYKHFPLIFWRELFEEIEDQLIEYDGKEKVSSLINADNNDNDQKKLKKDLKATLPKLSFTIESKKLQIIHSNISEITIKFYLIDLEILFSRNPFISSSTNDFSFVKPNYTTVLKVDKSLLETQTLFEIPKDYIAKNIFIEVSSESKKSFETYFSADLQVVISENLGELKVCDNKLISLRKAYVKCFAKMNDNTVKFYKDGYTDLRGLFNYLSLNTNQIRTIKKIAIFVCHDDNGSIIKECNPPYNIGQESTGEDDIVQLQKYKQEQRTKWRVFNK